MELELEHNVRRICGVSQFLIPEIYNEINSNKPILSKYLGNSNNRKEFFKKQLESLGYTSKENYFDFFTQKLSNITFSKKPNKKKRILITFNSDYKREKGAETNASGMSVALYLAKKFDNLEFVIFDTEEWHQQGSNKYVQQNDLKNIEYIINLYALGLGERLVICKQEGDVNSIELVSKLWESSETLGYEFEIQSYDNAPLSHTSFAIKGKKAVSIISQGSEFSNLNQEEYEKLDYKNLEQVTKTIIHFNNKINKYKFFFKKFYNKQK